MTVTLAPAPTGLRLWWLAIRPKTLTISVVPVLVATSLAWVEAGRVDPLAALVAALAAMLIQAGTNLHNDAGDFLRGGDAPGRLGPRRAAAQGWASPRRVLRASQSCFGLAALCGVYLIWLGGWPMLVLGLLSILAGWSYTGGPRPIAYTPLGEVFVVAFFGLAAVGGTYWLHVGALSPAALVAGLAVGLLAAAVLVVNNYRDLEGDAAVGRRTLPVIIGRPATKALYAALLTGPFLLIAPLSAVLATADGWTAFLAAPVAGWLVRSFITTPVGPAFNRILAHTAMLQVLFGGLLAAGLAWP